MDQGTPEWHAARLGKITASGFSNIMKEVKAGESTFKIKYRQELAIERVTGKVANEVFMNQFMRDGVEREPIARQLFINKSGLDVDSKKAYFCSYNPNYPEKLQLKIVEVARDDKMISAMEAAARQFNIEIEDLITKLENING